MVGIYYFYGVICMNSIRAVMEYIQICSPIEQHKSDKNTTD